MPSLTFDSRFLCMSENDSCVMDVIFEAWQFPLGTQRKVLADEPRSGPSCWPGNVRDSMRCGGRVHVTIHLHYCHDYPATSPIIPQRKMPLQSALPLSPLISHNLDLNWNVQFGFYFDSHTLRDACCAISNTTFRLTASLQFHFYPLRPGSTSSCGWKKKTHSTSPDSLVGEE